MEPQTVSNETTKTATWPQLFGTTSTGGIKTWQIFVVKQIGFSEVMIRTQHGKLDGKLTEQIKMIKTGKNIGKSNETSPWEQACSEAASTFQEKLDKKYITEIPNGKNESKAILPMLAHDFRKRSHDIEYPAWVQPKFNGVRCLAHKTSMTSIEFISRKGKSYNNVCQHLVSNLLQIMKTDEIFDGELYVHGWSFQKILKTTKKPRPWGNELEYHVYDLADDTDESFLVRYEKIGSWILKLPTNTKIKVVETSSINSSDWVKTFHDRYVSEGYEGVIIRNGAGLYKFGHRSKDLQKYKEFIDAEFLITGFCDEPIMRDGNEYSAIVFTCVDKNGKEFNVRPKGTIADRVAWFAKGQEFCGKELTVRYQSLSESGTPIFPIGICIRDYE